MKPGDMCTIWSGYGSLSDRRNWLIGIVLREKKRKIWEETRYQVLWNDLGADDVWYTGVEISLDQITDAKS